ncbi:Methyltransferase domain-containing protein [Piscibacillus halophilus]|uniref:Methyltransferase domain-containing protein n=1 Tax=Piscibacillus halophilus TaxID=571933 RepID=A0A1H9MF28_9BACI|nr:Methyltransferase domain-containing protein [Piscibacillus halophilus]
MQLSPIVYDSFVRQRWLTKKYIHQYIMDHCELESKHVLDFGSGTGANCTLVSPEYYIGLDPDEKRVNFANKKYPDHRFNVMAQDQIPIPNHSIDLIMIIAVLHHIPLNKLELYIDFCIFHIPVRIIILTITEYVFNFPNNTKWMFFLHIT